MTALISQVLRRESLAEAEIAQAFELMCRHYHKVNRADFYNDLAEKHWVILVREGKGGPIRGFSTIRVYPFVYAGTTLRILYSGDTIVDRAHWNSMALPIGYGNLVRRLAEVEPMPTYWFLTSKGYRTYRSMPVFFERFYPCPATSTPPWEDGLINALATAKYGSGYDPESGLVRAGDQAQRLRRELGEASPQRHARDEHIGYFFERNPDHASGDELVCLAEFSTANMSSFYARRLEQNQVEVEA